jgi:hypothetical protein
MARRETPIAITSADEMPTWDQFPQAVRDIFLRGLERKLQRLEAEGVQVWLPAHVPETD